MMLVLHTEVTGIRHDCFQGKSTAEQESDGCDGPSKVTTLRRRLYWLAMLPGLLTLS